MLSADSPIKIFSGNSNPDLAEKICSSLGVPLGSAQVKTFSDGEIAVDLNESVRGLDTFVVQSTCPPVNNNLMELLIMIDALRRASAERINAVIPYYGYARQDRKVAPRQPISAKLIANLITVAGASRVLTIDLHAGQIQGFFDIPVDNLYASPIVLDYLRNKFKDDLVLIAPDAGGVERTRAFARRLDASLAIIDKRRERANVAQVMNIIGKVKGKTSVILDDMVDTAGTLTEAAKALKEHGAAAIFACCTHPVLSGSAIQKINDSPLEELIVTDTIPINQEAGSCKKIKVLSVADLFGEAIKRIHNNESVSSLFV
ncbi:MAG: phosphoribosylpyrophosphate synthetase [Deltaproteobacteria bacterium RBG_16_54_11]|jgi:ribose-phosphate pyrophosphokinase|nr:MAG: phosphoribosylpyrophosphate synthetase [Deltaproteobacteria bacterium RBG_16_54_11]